MIRSSIYLYVKPIQILQLGNMELIYTKVNYKGKNPNDIMSIRYNK